MNNTNAFAGEVVPAASLPDTTGALCAEAPDTTRTLAEDDWTMDSAPLEDKKLPAVMDRPPARVAPEVPTWSPPETVAPATDKPCVTAMLVAVKNPSADTCAWWRGPNMNPLLQADTSHKHGRTCANKLLPSVRDMTLEADPAGTNPAMRVPVYADPVAPVKLLTSAVLEVVATDTAPDVVNTRSPVTVAPPPTYRLPLLTVTPAAATFMPYPMAVFPLEATCTHKRELRQRGGQFRVGVDTCSNTFAPSNSSNAVLVDDDDT